MAEGTVVEDAMSATLTIAGPAAEVFAALADPTTHAAIDGTGWVRDAGDRAPLTGAGQVFRMAMYHPGHPDGDYRTANKVHVFDPPRAIGWMTGYEKEGGELEFGGWAWRYDLAPLDPARTAVTYDWSAAPASVREHMPFPPFGPDHLVNSLRHLADLVGSTPRAPTSRS